MPEPVNVFTPPEKPFVNPSPAAPRSVEGTQATPPSYSQSPQERWQADQDAATRADPWRDPNKVMTRDAAGNISFRDRDASDSPAPADGAKPGTAAVADNLLKLTAADGREFTLTPEDVAGLQERHAAELARKATLPADANGYEVKLSDSFKAPEGVEMRLDPANPAYADLKAFAHQNGWTQQTFSDVLGLYAAQVAKEQSQMQAARAAEVAKLGVNSAQRIEAVTQWWSSMTGDDGRVLGTILKMAPTAGTVSAFERLIQRYTSQGGGSFSGGHREAGDFDARKVSQAEYDNMSYAQKKQYAEDYAAAQNRRR